VTGSQQTEIAKCNISVVEFFEDLALGPSSQLRHAGTQDKSNTLIVQFQDFFYFNHYHN